MASITATQAPPPAVGDDGAMTDRGHVADWVAAYERAWRSPGTDALSDLFTESASYSPSPWAEPHVGFDAIGRFWEAARTGPDEGFELQSEVVAVEGSTAVVRVAVAYDDGHRWRDLWVLRMADDGRCEHFEEWPFAPGQPDGHEADQ